MKPATHRVYLRHAHQRTTHKTTTEDVRVAEYAFMQLVAYTAHPFAVTAAVHTRDGTQVKYVSLHELVSGCPKCTEVSLIDGYCWECKRIVDVLDAP